MKAHFVEAGFVDNWIGASFDTFNTPEEFGFIHQIVQQWFLAPEITEAAIKSGSAPQAFRDQIGTAYDTWKDQPGAFAAAARSEVAAWKPAS